MSLSFGILNFTVLTQVLHELRKGNLERCRALGFADEDLRLLQAQSPKALSRLAHARVSWVCVQVDLPVLRHLIAQCMRDELKEALINRALTLGASSAIMYRCFAMEHSETAMRRRLLKIPGRKGRPRHLSEAQEHALWRRWRQLSPPGSGHDPADQLEAMMQLAEEQQVSLTLIWQQVALHGAQQ